MRICIYCLERKPDEAFDREHVIPQAFGKFERNLVLDCVCKACNQYFANTIDLKFARDSIEGFDRFESGMKPASEFKSLGPNSTTIVKFAEGAIQGATGYTVANPDGPGLKVMAFPQVGFEQPPKPMRWFRVDEVPEKARLTEFGFDRGETNIHVREMSTDAATELLEAKGYVLLGGFVTTEPPADTDTIETERVGIIGRPEKRAATKIAINYVASVAGPALVRTAAFDDVRNFARHDVSESRVHVSENPWMIHKSGGAAARGHYLAAQTQPSGRIVVQVSLFLRIRYVVHLMAINLATGTVVLQQGHFFDIDNYTVTQVAPPPLMPGRQLKVAASED
jgi:hypothetical protein